MRKNGANLKKYTAYYAFFKEIDTEEKAYWLGFIAADGFITTRDNTVGITLGRKDKNHLFKFTKSISATNPVNDYVADTAYGKKQSHLASRYLLLK